MRDRFCLDWRRLCELGRRRGQIEGDPGQAAPAVALAQGAAPRKLAVPEQWRGGQGSEHQGGARPAIQWALEQSYLGNFVTS